MEIIFTRHAKRRMKWREIRESEIKETINSPDRVETALFGRKNAYKNIGDKLLKVTYVEESSKIVIISVVDKNR